MIYCLRTAKAVAVITANSQCGGAPVKYFARLNGVPVGQTRQFQCAAGHLLVRQDRGSNGRSKMLGLVGCVISDATNASIP